MVGCVPCFVIPLLLFIFHRYIQPFLLLFWNPWANKTSNDGKNGGTKEKCEFSCECAWSKKKSDEIEKDQEERDDASNLHGTQEKVKSQ
ncbi:unnamed protein product [Ceutorhynchus assimilis]|uniref:Uncharacterized protein n=1 Tax=Ceutorhynchus assimilis TaxID=467358 RepID=A0A9N9QDY5_9CUCU|nr:unnamed protein product [Ceutorhynchus assimilis]